MIDWSKIVGFDWDAGNTHKNEKKHGVVSSEAEQIFFNEPLVIAEDQKHGSTEQRFHALGKTEDHRLLHITFTLRDGDRLIRVISARDMHHKEKATYEQS